MTSISWTNQELQNARKDSEFTGLRKLSLNKEFKETLFAKIYVP